MKPTLKIKVSFELDTGITEADRQAMGEELFKAGCDEIVNEFENNEGVSATYEVVSE